jgi:hypothetical protein
VPFNPKDHRLDRDIGLLAELVRTGAVSEFVRGAAPRA